MPCRTNLQLHLLSSPLFPHPCLAPQSASPTSYLLLRLLRQLQGGFRARLQLSFHRC